MLPLFSKERRLNVPYKYKLVTVKSSTSTKKAKKAESKAKKALKKAEKKKSKSDKAVRTLKKAPNNESASAKATRLAKLKKAEKRKSADDKNYQRKKSAYSKASSKLSKLNKQKKQQEYDSQIAQQLEEHDSEWHNEGNCAIYPTNASKNGTKIIYILPSDSENESNSVNVTSWPADKGTPKSSYARMTDRGITVEGIITGQNGDNAHDKYVTLRKWAEDCVELSYRGGIVYYTHLIISGLSKDNPGLKDDLHVSITFKYVTAASISTKSGKSKKSAKASKSKSGKRTKKYTALTIKPGDTLWALSKKYGKSVKWLAKVNKIKDPNKIYAGKKIRVR